MVAPLLIAAGIVTALNLATSWFASKKQKKGVKKTLAAQKQANKINRANDKKLLDQSLIDLSNTATELISTQRTITEKNQLYGRSALQITADTIEKKEQTYLAITDSFKYREQMREIEESQQKTAAKYGIQAANINQMTNILSTVGDFVLAGIYSKRTEAS